MNTPRQGDAPLPLAGDTAALLRALRPRVAAARATAAAGDDRAALPALPALRGAAAHTDVGVHLPPLDHLHPLRRALATAGGRVLLYVLRLISIDQTHFNRLVVDAVGELATQTQRERDALRTMIAAAREAAAAAAQDAATATAVAACAARAEQLAAHEEAMRHTAADHATALAALRTRQETLALDIATLRDATERLRTQTDVLRRRAAAPAAAIEAAPAQGSQAIETWMVAETFRGDEAAVRERLRRYLPLFQGRGDVLDVGCGRGEFLELLRDAGVTARGVDRDRDMALWCQEKGLDVVCGDAAAELARLPAGSLDGVFCAQVVEHLTTAAMLRLIELAARALRPNGILVVETLNPESLLVLYRWFWVDLTHERLVHPQTLRIVCEASGLRDIEIQYVPPPAGALRLPRLEVPGADPPRLADFNRATEYLNDLLYGSFDYAVIGIR